MLAKSKLGRRMLRPLLRSEVGEVSNRRAWHEAGLLTAEVLDHYKRPLRARNWDAALVEVSRLPREVSERQVAGLCGAAARFPSAVITGAHDCVSTPQRAAQLAADLGGGRPVVVRSCGHLSHEETPAALLKALSAFVARALADAAPPLSATPSSATLSSSTGLSRTASGMSARGGAPAGGDESSVPLSGGKGVAAVPPLPVSAAHASAAGAPELQYPGG